MTAALTSLRAPGVTLGGLMSRSRMRANDSQKL